MSSNENQCSTGLAALDVFRGAFIESALTNEQVSLAVAEEARAVVGGECAFLGREVGEIFSLLGVDNAKGCQ